MENHSIPPAGRRRGDSPTRIEARARASLDFARGIAALIAGAKHGWEARRLEERLGFQVIGTDISKSARKFPGVIQWGFHQSKNEWLGSAT